MLASLLLALLTACSSAPKNFALPEIAPRHINSALLVVDVGLQRIETSEHKIYLLPLHYFAEGASIGKDGGQLGAVFGLVFGTLGLVIGTAEMSDHAIAQLRLSPAEKLLRQSSLKTMLLDELERELRPLPWFRDGKAAEALPGEYSQAATDARLAGMSEDAMLLIRFRYYIPPSLDEVQITGDAYLFPKSITLQEWRDDHYDGSRRKPPTAPRNAIYSHRHRFVKKLEAPAASRGKALDAWLANNGEKLLQAIHEGYADIARHVANDLQAKPDTSPLSANGLGAQ